jgi:hypothetical protein
MMDVIWLSLSQQNKVLRFLSENEISYWMNSKKSAMGIAGFSGD